MENSQVTWDRRTSECICCILAHGPAFLGDEDRIHLPQPSTATVHFSVSMLFSNLSMSNYTGPAFGAWVHPNFNLVTWYVLDIGDLIIPTVRTPRSDPLPCPGRVYLAGLGPMADVSDEPVVPVSSESSSSSSNLAFVAWSGARANQIWKIVFTYSADGGAEMCWALCIEQAEHWASWWWWW